MGVECGAVADVVVVVTAVPTHACICRCCGLVQRCQFVVRELCDRQRGKVEGGLDVELVVEGEIERGWALAAPPRLRSGLSVWRQRCIHYQCLQKHVHMHISLDKDIPYVHI